MKQNFASRFYIYQKERFPFFAHGILISIFTFSAISYSRICRGQTDFIALTDYIAVAFNTVTLFFLLRLSDEFKDKAYDAEHRPYLPVPRGLIALRELAVVGAVTVALQIAVNALIFPPMFLLYFVVVAFLALMFKEFFVGHWLQKHPMWYIATHMLIIPLIDIYASGSDWLLNGVDAPHGLLFFFAVSLMNGVVLEFGRKIRVAENEEHNTYSRLYGANKATRIWIVVLFATLLLSLAAAYYARYGMWEMLILCAVFVLCAGQGVAFLRHKTVKGSKRIELFSGLWTAAMYLILGGLPMLVSLFAE